MLHFVMILKTDSFLKLAVLFQETMKLFLINQVYQVIIVKRLFNQVRQQRYKYWSLKRSRNLW